MFRGTAAELEAESNKLLDKINAIELEIKMRCMQFRQIVDRHENELLEELQSLKSAAEKEVKWRRNTLQTAMTEMGSLRTSALDMRRSNSSTTDITQAAIDVHAKAKELLQNYIFPGEHHATSLLLGTLMNC